MVAALSDDEALTALRSRDPAALDRVVVAWTPGMLRLARIHTRREALAEDVVQDSWLAVLTGLDAFEGRSSLRTWVFGIVVNKARRAGARDRRLLPFSAAGLAERADLRAPAVEPDRFGPDGGWVSPPVHWEGFPEEQLAATELRMVVEAALTTLPIRQRAVVTARDVLGLSAMDVAVLYRLSEGNQRVLLHRARAKLRGAVERYAAGEPVEGAITAPRPHGRAAVAGPEGALACRQLVELVDDYLDASLSPDLRTRVEEHLTACDHCRGYVEQVRRVLDVTALLVTPSPEAAELARLLEALRGHPGQRPDSDSS